MGERGYVCVCVGGVSRVCVWECVSGWVWGDSCECGYLCDDLIFVAGSGLNPVPDLVGRTLIYQYILYII